MSFCDSNNVYKHFQIILRLTIFQIEGTNHSTMDMTVLISLMRILLVEAATSLLQTLLILASNTLKNRACATCSNNWFFDVNDVCQSLSNFVRVMMLLFDTT